MGEGERPVPSWIELLMLMVQPHNPEPTLHGAIRSLPGADPSAGYVGWASSDGPPMFTGVRGNADSEQAIRDAPAVRVWRDGHRVRVEEPDARPNLIVGDETAWVFDREHDLPLATPRRRVRYEVNGTQLLTRRELSEFVGDDFTKPAGPITATRLLDRPAWTVELAPPPHKPHPIQLVIDADTGIVLQQRCDGFGSVDEWIEFTVGDALDPALFTWTGRARSSEDQQAQLYAEFEADKAQRRAWFNTNITAEPIRLEIELDIYVHEHDDAGAFHASLDEGHIGSLARRPRSTSTEPWNPAGAEPTHRWSTGRWDWALTLWQGRATTDSIDRLQRQLSQNPSD